MVQGLIVVDSFGDLDDGVFATREVVCELWFRVGLFLEDEGGKEGDDFFGLKSLNAVSVLVGWKFHSTLTKQARFPR